MSFKKNTLSVLILLVIVLLICYFTSTKPTAINTSVNQQNPPQIILDAGHGGFDGGAVANDGTVEKDINLEICLSLENMLKQNGFEVIMTRTADTSTDSTDSDKISSRKKSDLKNRLELMNTYNNAVFVSIHLNKFTTSAANGSQVFYSGRDEKSKLLGDKIQSSIIRLLQPENARVNKKVTSSTYLLYNATVPAVLVECGFLSNSAELTKLKNPQYQKEMAFSIFCGITDFLNNKEI